MTPARFVIPALVVALAPAPAAATYTVLAVDADSGRMAVASATCLPQAAFRGMGAAGLHDVQAVVVPGSGVAVAQAEVDPTGAIRTSLQRALEAGTAPEQALRDLASAPGIARRQLALLDRRGRAATFSGPDTIAAVAAVSGQVRGTTLYYLILGNLLASDAVVTAAAGAFEAGRGDLVDRVLAAMDAAETAGGDRRCSCEAPSPPAPGRCTVRHALVAYLLTSGGTADDGGPAASLFLEVTDEDRRTGEDPSPVRALVRRFDVLRAR